MEARLPLFVARGILRTSTILVVERITARRIRFYAVLCIFCQKIDANCRSDPDKHPDEYRLSLAPIIGLGLLPAGFFLSLLYIKEYGLVLKF